MGTSEACESSVVEFSGGNGAPEEIRTPDPQIRSLVHIRNSIAVMSGYSITCHSANLISPRSQNIK